MIEDTSSRDPHLHLLGAMIDGNTKYITDMESAGQRQLVASQQIPIEGSAGLEDLGFVLGDKTDDLFRNVELPAGWRKEGSDHAMWSYILDEHGRRRVAVFYKAAFYDRRAFCRVQTVDSYVFELVSSLDAPIVDDVWATPAAIQAAAQKYIERESETITLYRRPDIAEDRPEYAAEQIAEAEQNILKAQGIIARAGWTEVQP